MPPPPNLLPRKLLIASIGVATINYVATACGGSTTNDPGGTTKDAGSDITSPPTSANLPAPPPTSANLPAPPPIDAGDDVITDASDDADGG